MNPRVCGFFILASFAFAACGGGGGGGATAPVVVEPSVAGVPTTGPTAAPTAPAFAISGSVVEFTSGTSLAGFTVTVGQVPPAATCLSAESNTSMPCGIPAAPTYVATTGSSGGFTVAVPASGTYMLTIGKDTTYATLHRTITVGQSPLTLGTLKIAALSTDEQNWVVDINNQRATVSVPVSFSNLVVDEYAEEQARAEVAAIVSGAAPYGDATEEQYSASYASSAGSLYGAAGVADLYSSSHSYKAVDAAWMAENINCVGDDWETCAANDSTGHYINVSNTQSVWIGVGESVTAYVYAPYGNEWAYAALIPTNYEQAFPAFEFRRDSMLR